MLIIMTRIKWIADNFGAKDKQTVFIGLDIEFAILRDISFYWHDVCVCVRGRRFWS